MDTLLLIALLLRVVGAMLPWILALFLTSFIMDLAEIKSQVWLVFLFGFVFVGLFLRDEILPTLFKDKGRGEYQNETPGVSRVHRKARVRKE